MSAPIIISGSYVGTGKPRNIALGFKPDLVFINGELQYASFQHDYTWNGGRQSFANVNYSGTDGTMSTFTDEGFSLRTDSSNNKIGTTYHYLAIADNGSDILQTGNYPGYRYQSAAANGANSDPVTLDILRKKPDFYVVKRDNVTQEGVVAVSGITKLLSNADVDNTLLTVNNDGTLSLSTNVRVNQNDSMYLGEAHNFFAFYDNGNNWQKIDYVGTGVAMPISTSCVNPIAAIVIPHTTTQPCFNWGTMGALSGDGSNSPLAANKIIGYTANSVSIGTDAAVNAVGVSYTMVVFNKSTPQQVAIPTIVDKTSIRFRRVGSTVAHLSNGFNTISGIAGAHSVQWVGAISSNGSEQALIMRSGNAVVGSRSSTTKGAFNWGMAYTDGSASCGLEIVVDDTFENHAAGGGTSIYGRWRTGWKPITGKVYDIQYTFDGVDKWLLYVDGKIVMWRRFPIQAVLGLNGTVNTSGLVLGMGGRYDPGTWVASQNSLIRYACVYSRAISAAEVYSNYKRNKLGYSVPYISNGLLEEWNLIEGAGATTSATVNSANNLNITNGAWVNP
jgi:hypothetical protein